ncbi:glycoproteins [Ebinur lake virus]|uniref:Envelopment polyprotein n=1 Tax=Ebinur lake virus TaxID=1501396 RepID=A0A059WG92_9VIRU|nr:glycoproteins [Ebinur lake virus]AIA08881.1 glycoproteins [Ebinur lake virus]UXO90797.1 glycoprotein precursor [Reverse genetics vector pLCK-EBIV-M]
MAISIVLMIIFSTTSCLARAAPSISKCFQDGVLIAEKKSSSGISEFCIKDDISILKSEINYSKNDTGIFMHSKVFRHWTVADWKQCQPIPSAGGSINVLEVDKNLNLVAKNYMCTRPCVITIDKENAQLLFQTEQLNQFEVTGTTISTGWFKSKTSVSLDNTCEHIKVTCGKKSLQFHACFKQHMSCVRFLHRSVLPGYMANSICQNIELIIIITLTLAIFIFMCIITRTYICYIMLPLFAPIAYIYGWLYNRSCKKCICCGLAYHPFTNCGSYCVCGSRFETSDRMRLHRESGLCQGFKSLRVARTLCKSKGSSLVISVLTAMLILSFVTPLEAISTNYPTDRKYTLNEVNDIVLGKGTENELKTSILALVSICGIGIIIIFIALTMLLDIVLEAIAKRSTIFCTECNLIHDKKAMKFVGDFTNKCGFCPCGELEDPEGLVIHTTRKSCTYYIKIRNLKLIMLVFSIAILMQNTAMLVVADENCWTNTEIKADCVGPLIGPTTCTNKGSKTYKAVAQELVTSNKITQLDADKYTLLGDTIESALSAITEQKHYSAIHLLETIFLMKHCDYYKVYEHNSGYSQTKWRLIAKTNSFDICSIPSTPNFCKCLSDSSCSTSTLNFATSMNSTYTSKAEYFNHDFTLFLNIFEAAFPGSATAFLFKKIKEKAPYQAFEMMGKIANKYPNNKLLVVLLKYGQYMVGLSHASTYQLKQEWIAKSLSLVRSTKTGLKMAMTNAEPGPATKECSDAKTIACLTPKFQVEVNNLMSCGASPNFKIYMKSGELYKAHDRNSVWCLNDMHCLTPYTPANAELVATMKKMECWQDNPKQPTNDYATPRRSCQMKDRGLCNVGADKWKVIKCDDDLMFYTDALESPDPAADIGQYCFSEKCQIERYPINPTSLTNCEWLYRAVKPQYIKRLSLQTIEEYKKAITDKLTHTLQLYHFAPLENLPHIRPTYEYITAQGTYTADGIEGASIITSIPALSGTSVGFKINAKDGTALLDIVVYIKSSVVKSVYNHIYDTGPTININSKHDELCTGQCPKRIPADPNWLTFSQERTSRWGCEEFGCLAINTGCVYGSCQDVIRTETKVYRKANEETVMLTVCITYPGHTFCTDVNALEPKITDELELQFKTIDIKSLPNLVAITNHKLYTGQINDLGTFGQMCGNVQKTNTSILGAGTPKFDYTCYSASRKDIIIRRCYNNNYDSCRLLKQEGDLLFDDNHETLIVYNNKRLNGELTMKLLLGDIQYKLYTENMELELEAKCVGCVGCFESYQCNLQITSSLDGNCAISGPCETFHDRIQIKTTKKDYALKLACTKDPGDKATFRVCGKDYDFNFHTVVKNDKIEVNVGDETSYIKEKDARCGTWLCRVRDEGLSVIFEPLKNFFGNYLNMFLYILGGVLLLFLSLYIIMPVCARLRDELKKNEKLHQMEMKKR